MSGGVDFGREGARMSKYDHVREAQQTRAHVCHWPGCQAQVPPAMWGCRPHWYRLPRHLRAAIWAAYRSGQEETLNVSPAYLAAARAAQAWIGEHSGPGGDE